MNYTITNKIQRFNKTFRFYWMRFESEQIIKIFSYEKVKNHFTRCLFIYNV